METLTETKWQLWCRHRNGWNAHGNKTSLSGCGDDWTRTMGKHGAESVGAYVVDADAVPTDVVVRGVVSGPMVDTTLAEPDPGPDVSPGKSMVADFMAAEPDNQFGAMVRGARAGSVALSTVPTADYVAYWRQLGARVGRIVDESGTVEWLATIEATPKPTPKAGPAGAVSIKYRTKGGGWTRGEIPAYAVPDCPGLVVHRMADYDDDGKIRPGSKRDPWTVTHAASGLAFGVKRETRAELLAALTAAAAKYPDADWTKGEKTVGAKDSPTADFARFAKTYDPRFDV